MDTIRAQQMSTFLSWLQKNQHLDLYFEYLYPEGNLVDDYSGAYRISKAYHHGMSVIIETVQGTLRKYSFTTPMVGVEYPTTKSAVINYRDGSTVKVWFQ